MVRRPCQYYGVCIPSCYPMAAIFKLQTSFPTLFSDSEFNNFIVANPFPISIDQFRELAFGQDEFGSATLIPDSAAPYRHIVKIQSPEGLAVVAVVPFSSDAAGTLGSDESPHPPRHT